MEHQETALAVQGPREVAQATPNDLLAQAVAGGANIETITALVALKERMEDRDAKQEFNRAMVACQAAMPRVTKNAQVVNHKTGAIQSRYATFDRIDAIAREVYQAHGFSISYGTGNQEGGKYIISATVRHSGGHSEEYRIPLALDQSGAKNDTQGMGSTVSYGKRYLLCMIFNITIEGEDTDGNGAVAKISPHQVEQLISRLDATNSNKAKFCQLLGIVALEDLPANRWIDADRELKRKEAKV